MVLIFIGAYIALAILVYLMFRVLKKSVNSIGDQSKTYYIDKLDEYDEIINQKEEKINTLNEEIKNKKVEVESIKNDIAESSVDFDVDIIGVLASAKYRDKSLFEIEKIVDEEFSYDFEKIISEFIKQSNEAKDYDFCKKLRRKFSSKSIYEYNLLTKMELEEKLDQVLNEKEKKILSTYRKTHKKFSLDEFVNYLDELVALNDPKIIVYVGNKNENYDHLSKLVKTKVDKNIYRGIKISYRGKIYDYSLNGRNL